MNSAPVSLNFSLSSILTNGVIDFFYP